MRIVGEWLLCDDGVTRPVVRAEVQAADGSLQADVFLIDSWRRPHRVRCRPAGETGFPMNLASEGMILQGIGGVVRVRGCENRRGFDSR